FHPGGGIAHAAVFERTKPEQYQSQPMVTRTVHQRVYFSEVELSGFGFYGLPVYGGFYGITVEFFHLWPDAGQDGGPGAGVPELSTQDEEGFAIYIQCIFAIFPDNFREGYIRWFFRERRKPFSEERNKENAADEKDEEKVSWLFYSKIPKFVHEVL